jgi:hypothetical protein
MLTYSLFSAVALLAADIGTAAVPSEFQAWVLVSADLGENRFANFRIKVNGGQSEYSSPLLPVAPRSLTFNELHSVLGDVKTERW